MMRKQLFYFILSLSGIGFSLFFGSCRNDHEEDLIINDTIQCDSLNITYTKIKSIFENNCVRCHNDEINNLGIRLNSYENARNAAQTGRLKKAVNHLPGVTPMPYQLPKLDNCNVRKITIWIDTNTPE